jgi:hypothetical protein
MQSSASDANDPAQGIESSVPDPTQQPSEKRSIWDKAKDALSDASQQASKAAALSASRAAKAAELGKQSFNAASDATRSALEMGKQSYVGSSLASAISQIDEELEKRGAKKAIADTTGALVGKLDQVTGKRLVEMLEQKLRIQDMYNDALATRLAEALERIAKLEAQYKHGN